jgi:hypothetical protein
LLTKEKLGPFIGLPEQFLRQAASQASIIGNVNPLALYLLPILMKLNDCVPAWASASCRILPIPALLPVPTAFPENKINSIGTAIATFPTDITLAELAPPRSESISAVVRSSIRCIRRVPIFVSQLTRGNAKRSMYDVVAPLPRQSETLLR